MDKNNASSNANSENANTLTIIYTPPRPTIDVDTTLKLSVGNTMETSRVKAEFHDLRVKLNGDWEKLGLFADDIDTMAFDMETALVKIIRKYIQFNRVFIKEEQS